MTTFSDVVNNGFAKLYILDNGGMDGMGTFLLVSAILLCCILGYFLGSINFAIILSKKKSKGDVRGYGSKNAGATNMFRIYGKKAAALTFLGDFLKAVLACFLGRVCWGLEGAYLAGLFCVLGHVFPIFFKFKGGKGVSTTAGVMFACDILTFIIILILYALVFLASKMVSLASIMSALMYTFILYNVNNVFAVPPGIHTLLSLCISIIVVVKHIENIKRIVARTEPKINLFSKKQKSSELEDESASKPSAENKKSLHNDD